LPGLDPGIHVFFPIVADKDLPRVKPGGGEKLGCFSPNRRNRRRQNRSARNGVGPTKGASPTIISATGLPVIATSVKSTALRRALPTRRWRSSKNGVTPLDHDMFAYLAEMWPDT
jgi:hypothetical protein